MGKLTGEKITAAFKEHLHPDEELKYHAFGIKQPSVALIAPLYALGIIPGVIAVTLLTKNYLIGLTERRFIAKSWKRTDGQPLWSLSLTNGSLVPGCSFKAAQRQRRGSEIRD